MRTVDSDAATITLLNGSIIFYARVSLAEHISARQDYDEYCGRNDGSSDLDRMGGDTGAEFYALLKKDLLSSRAGNYGDVKQEKLLVMRLLITELYHNVSWSENG